MKMKVAGMFFCVLVMAWINDSRAGDQFPRTRNRVGIYGSINEPTFAPYGANLAVNVASWLRISAGYGGGLGMKTYGGMLHFFIVPSWNFSPTIGVGVSQYKSNGNILPAGEKTTPSLQLGFDWQTDSGFFLGFGLAYLSIGWFFL